jgi:hypothetical protein
VGPSAFGPFAAAEIAIPAMSMHKPMDVMIFFMAHPLFCFALCDF